MYYTEKKQRKKAQKKNRFSFLTTNLKFLLITREKNAKNVFFWAKNIVFFSSKNVFMSFYPKPKMILLAYFCPILHGKKSFCPMYYLNLFFLCSFTDYVLLSFTLLSPPFHLYLCSRWIAIVCCKFSQQLKCVVS